MSLEWVVGPTARLVLTSRAMKRLLWLLFPAASVAVLAACDGTIIRNTSPDGGPPPVCNISCPAGENLDVATCSCVPDSTCPDPGICGSGLQWDTSQCRCVPAGQCQPIPCTPPNEWNQSECMCTDIAPPPDAGFGCTMPNGQFCGAGQTCSYQASPGCTLQCECSSESQLACSDLCISPPPPPSDAGPGYCNLPNGGLCGAGMTCVIGICADGSEQVCQCDSSGQYLSCSVCGIGVDAGPPPPPPPPPPPSGCYLPGGGYCEPFTTCVIGYCPDGMTPISCYCEGNGNSQCTGACPPGDGDSGVITLDAGTLPP